MLFLRKKCAVQACFQSPALLAARESARNFPRVCFSPQIQVSILGHRRRPSSPTSRRLECRPRPSSIRPKSQLPKPPLPHAPSPSAAEALLSSPPRCRLEVHRWPPPSSSATTSTKDTRLMHVDPLHQGPSVLSFLTKAAMKKTNQGLH
jgi:hypothetical protein